jgi:hypothetical protein
MHPPVYSGPIAVALISRMVTRILLIVRRFSPDSRLIRLSGEGVQYNENTNTIILIRIYNYLIKIYILLPQTVIAKPYFEVYVSSNRPGMFLLFSCI